MSWLTSVTMIHIFICRGVTFLVLKKENGSKNLSVSFIRQLVLSVLHNVFSGWNWVVCDTMRKTSQSECLNYWLTYKYPMQSQGNNQQRINIASVNQIHLVCSFPDSAKVFVNLQECPPTRTPMKWSDNRGSVLTISHNTNLISSDLHSRKVLRLKKSSHWLTNK